MLTHKSILVQSDSFSYLKVKLLASNLHGLAIHSEPAELG